MRGCCVGAITAGCLNRRSVRLLFTRLKTVWELLAGLSGHDLAAARNWISSFYPGRSLPVRLLLFTRWGLALMWRDIPESTRWARFATPVSRTPVWLSGPDPFENHPFAQNPAARFPERAEVVVIGAGMVGAASAYHWAKLAPAGDAQMVVLEMNGVASGSAGRNEGLVVMGRYYYYVHSTTLRYLARARADLDSSAQDKLAHDHAAAYCRAAYANAEMIEQTIAAERIDCDYWRQGWVQVQGEGGEEKLKNSTGMARERGFPDWTSIASAEVFERTGLRTDRPAGFSIGAASWHPAKWVRGLMRIALESGKVQLFTRTQAVRIEDEGEHYAVHTSRGTVRARYVINATESHTSLLFPEFDNLILPMQTQAAWGASDGGTMKGGVGISTDRAFYGRHGDGVIFGSDATRVRNEHAGRNRPSRFITRFAHAGMRKQFGLARLDVSHEWSGTVSYRPDEFPLVGLMDEKRPVHGGAAWPAPVRASRSMALGTWSNEFSVSPAKTIIPKSTSRRAAFGLGKRPWCKEERPSLLHEEIVVQCVRWYLTKDRQPQRLKSVDATSPLPDNRVWKRAMRTRTDRILA